MTSENFNVAMDFGKNQGGKIIQVLFVFLIYNFHKYIPYEGFRLNKNVYSAHMDEQELLIMEGAEVHVMGVE